MGEITLNQIRDLMLWVIAFATATYTIVKAVRKAIEKGFEPIEKKIDKVDMNATKNYLVQTICDVDSKGYIDPTNKIRFYEQFEHYQKDLGGNSYIKDEVERLKKEGKL